MSKKSRKPQHHPVGTGSERLRWLLFGWFHLDTSSGVTCAHWKPRPGTIRFDDHQPQASLRELLSVPPEQATDRVFENLLQEQRTHGPRIHSSALSCIEYIIEHIDAIFPKKPELAGLKAVVAMREFAGHPREWRGSHNTKTHANALLISLERMPIKPVQANRQANIPGSFVKVADEFTSRKQAMEKAMAHKQKQQEPVDQLYFDGSAEPNPGGRMGAGWRLIYHDQAEETGVAEWPAARGNTNNKAEYLALIGALTGYLNSGRPGPLLVQGDSQLVINQMAGEWGINNPALWQLNQQAAALEKRIPGGVRYRWIPREENQVADTLAGGQLRQEQTPLVYAERIDAAGLAAALAEQIARLNRVGKLSFKEAMSLRVGGRDQYSRWHLPELVVAVGAACVALVEAAFPGETDDVVKARETALRWMVRGLAAQLAIRKVQVDQEVQANRRETRRTSEFI